MELLFSQSRAPTKHTSTPTDALNTQTAAADVFLDDSHTHNNETSVILDEITSSLDRIISHLAKQEEAATPKNKAPQSPCAPRKGIVISNTMGLANNLFEVGFAHRLATDLCWPVLFRPHWQGEIPNSRAAECFPNAMLPTNHDSLIGIPHDIQTKLQLNSTFWKSVGTTKGNRAYQRWLAERQQEGVAVKVGNDAKLFTGDAPKRLVQEVRNETSQTSLLSLEAFFIHGDWMNEWSDKIREWFAMRESSCCHHQPPSDAVVIHVRDFGPKDETNMGIKPPVYTHIINQYNLTDRPVWIVCQPQTMKSAFVTELLDSLPHDNVTIVPGQGQYDAFCTLIRAKALLLTSASSFSQMAAFLSDADVHYPLKTLGRPKVTISVPGWKYHLVDKQSLDRVVQFDVGRDRITFKAA